MICSSNKPGRCAIVVLAVVAAALAVINLPLQRYLPVSHTVDTASKHLDSFTLKNGMQVVLFHDGRVPAVTHMLWYKVGAGDDYPGRSGLAHYNEHMMFQGTETTKSGQFLKEVAARGGQANAFTSHDYTAYFVTIAKEHLPLVMRMEADRMLHLAPSPENFAKEREVIIEERRMSIENRPEALLSEEMHALLFRNHPYRIPNIGWMHEMQALSRADVLAFHNQFYHPANAVLVVTGDITRSELQPLAEQVYGVLPAGEPYKRQWNSEPPQRGPRHTELRHVNVREPEFSRIYMAPSTGSAQGDQIIPGFLLAQILGGGSSSRLYQSLVVQQKLATDVSAGYDGFSAGPGEFSISATPAQGVTLPQLEAAIDKEIAAVRTTPPAPDELRRAKTLLKAETIFARDGIEGMARMLGMLTMEGLPPSYFLEWPQKVEEVTPEQVVQAAALSLGANQSVTGYLLPDASDAKGATP